MWVTNCFFFGTNFWEITSFSLKSLFSVSLASLQRLVLHMKQLLFWPIDWVGECSLVYIGTASGSSLLHLRLCIIQLGIQHCPQHSSFWTPIHTWFCVSDPCHHQQQKDKSGGRERWKIRAGNCFSALYQYHYIQCGGSSVPYISQCVCCCWKSQCSWATYWHSPPDLCSKGWYRYFCSFS